MTAPARAVLGDHSVRVDYDQDWWRCACGKSGKGRGDSDAGELARAHIERESTVLVPKLTPEQLGELLRRGAEDTARMAAVGLLIAHGHWLGDGYLRRYIEVRWEGTAGPVARVDWHRLRDALAEAHRAVRVLDHADAPHPALAAMQDWLDRRDSLQIHGSSSELAILRLAASLVTGYQISLYDDLGCLGNATRGLALTAIGHLLSHGGGLAFRSARSWPELTGDVR